MPSEGADDKCGRQQKACELGFVRITTWTRVTGRDEKFGHILRSHCRVFMPNVMVEKIKIQRESQERIGVVARERDCCWLKKPIQNDTLY